MRGWTRLNQFKRGKVKIMMTMCSEIRSKTKKRKFLKPNTERSISQMTIDLSWSLTWLVVRAKYEWSSRYSVNSGQN